MIRTLHLATLFSATFLLLALSAPTAFAGSATDPPCAEPGVMPFATKPTPWFRGGQIEVISADGFGPLWWEELEIASGEVIATGDFDTNPSANPIFGKQLVQRFRWSGATLCYHEGLLTTPTGPGPLPDLSLSPVSAGSYEYPLPAGVVLDRDSSSCDQTALISGRVVVKRGRKVVGRRSFDDLCDMIDSWGKEMKLGKGLSMAPTGYSDGVLLDVALDGPATEVLQVDITGERRYKLSRKYRVRRIDRPDRKIWTGTDEYWNYCVNEGKTVYAENGDYYCIKPGFDQIKVSRAR